MRNWAIAFILLAGLSGLACLGAQTHEAMSSARVLLVLFGSLGAYALTVHRQQSRGRRRPARGEPLEA